MRMPSLSPRVTAGIVAASETALEVLCRYEAEAISSRSCPPVSVLCRRRRWVEAALLAILLAHLHIKIAEAVQELESCDWEAEY